MDNRRLVFGSDAILLLTAALWGVGFTAQRSGMDYLSPFTFNSFRFFLGGISLIPLLLWLPSSALPESTAHARDKPWKELRAGVVCGLVLFLGAAFQQIGIVSTEAGKAGFISGLYVIGVPVIGLLWNQRPGRMIWIGAGLAVVGMYKLSVRDGFTIARGDLLVLISALFWAVHVQIIGYYSMRFQAIRLAFIQFMVCAILNFVVALAMESFTWNDILAAWKPILYSGIASIGIAHTLQIIAQRHSPPSHAAILMSMEAVFAVLAGWLFLGEVLDASSMTGCAFMFTGMILSQLRRG
jgi:drug/metabolite transporter (DMT)-like permease